MCVYEHHKHAVLVETRRGSHQNLWRELGAVSFHMGAGEGAMVLYRSSQC